jgi:hypothetical protein
VGSTLIFGGLPLRLLMGTSGAWMTGFFLGRPLFRFNGVVSGVSILILGGLPLGRLTGIFGTPMRGLFLGRPRPLFKGAIIMGARGGEGSPELCGVVSCLSARMRRGAPSFSTSHTKVPLLSILLWGNGFTVPAARGLMDIASVASRSPRENLSLGGRVSWLVCGRAVAFASSVVGCPPAAESPVVSSRMESGVISGV